MMMMNDDVTLECWKTDEIEDFPFVLVLVKLGSFLMLRATVTAWLYDPLVLFVKLKVLAS